MLCFGVFSRYCKQKGDWVMENFKEFNIKDLPQELAKNSLVRFQITQISQKLA